MHRLVHESIITPSPHHHHISITTQPPMQQPMHRPMHGPACPSSQTPIPWLVTCRHRDYMILLLSHTKFANFQVNLFISYSLQLCFWSSQWQVGLISASRGPGSNSVDSSCFFSSNFQVNNNQDQKNLRNKKGYFILKERKLGFIDRVPYFHQ